MLLASIFALSVVQPVLAQPATATSYSFNLIGPNTAVAEATVPGTPIVAGDVVRFTGSGTFDTSAATASGGGSFTHSRADGSLVVKGTWVVTGFQSFNSFGGPRPGTQGGVLLLTVTLVTSEATHPGRTLQVSCLVNAPSGSPDEGTTFPGLFSDPTGGMTLFHLND